MVWKIESVGEIPIALVVLEPDDEERVELLELVAFVPMHTAR